MFTTSAASAEPSYVTARLLVPNPTPRSVGLPVELQVIGQNVEPAQCLFSGVCGSDGSILDGSLRDLARGGWSVSCYQPNLSPRFFGLFGPLPGYWQTILRAELFALFMFLSHACPPFCVAIDNLSVIKGLARGKEWCCAPRRAHAQHHSWASCPRAWTSTPAL